MPARAKHPPEGPGAHPEEPRGVPRRQEPTRRGVPRRAPPRRAQEGQAASERMTPPFSTRTTPHFERLARALHRGHPEFQAIQGRAVEILRADPHFASRDPVILSD